MQHAIRVVALTDEVIMRHMRPLFNGTPVLGMDALYRNAQWKSITSLLIPARRRRCWRTSSINLLIRVLLFTGSNASRPMAGTAACCSQTTSPVAPRTRSPYSRMHLPRGSTNRDLDLDRCCAPVKAVSAVERWPNYHKNPCWGRTPDEARDVYLWY
jgi:hypothetical protein